MTAQNQQIVTAYEELGMTPEEIADNPDFGFDLTMIKAILMQSSSLYRKASKGDSRLQFSDTEADEVKGIILSIARYTEDEHLQFKAAKFIYEDKKGRLDQGRALANFNSPIIQFNVHYEKYMAARERTLNKAVELKNDKVELVVDKK